MSLPAQFPHFHRNCTSGHQKNGCPKLIWRDKKLLQKNKMFLEVLSITYHTFFSEKIFFRKLWAKNCKKSSPRNRFSGTVPATVVWFLCYWYQLVDLLISFLLMPYLLKSVAWLLSKNWSNFKNCKKRRVRATFWDATIG